MARLSRRNRKRLVSEINVVPYIDVMLGVIGDLYGDRTNAHSGSADRASRGLD